MPRPPRTVLTSTTRFAIGANCTYSYSARRKTLRVSATSRPAPNVKPTIHSPFLPAVPENENGVDVHVGGTLARQAVPGGFSTPDTVSAMLTLACPTATPA